MTLRILFVVFILLAGCADQNITSDYVAPAPDDSLDIKLQQIYDRGDLPGFAVSMFDKDDTYFAEAYGYADLEERTPYTLNTVQIIASVSKTLIGVSLMKLVEQGSLRLDDAVNDYLPFELVNPSFPAQTITIRHLATHTSGLTDPDAYNKSYLFDASLDSRQFPEIWQGLFEEYNLNEAMEMGEYVEEILSPAGTWYSAGNFTTNAPGDVYEYSNIGATLAAYIIEIVSGDTYQVFTEKHILSQLNMPASTWDLAAVNPQVHATYYLENKQPIPHYRIITIADGGLYSSVADMTNFLREIMKVHAGESDFLEQSSLREMTQKPTWDEELPDGVFWDLSFPCCIGHSGNDYGTSTFMYFQPETGIGRILFANITMESAEVEAAVYDAFNVLFE